MKKKILKFNFFLFYLFFILSSSNVFSIVPLGQKIQMRDNSWKDDKNAQANRYSLDYLDETCSASWDIGYQVNEAYANSEKNSELFFKPGIALRHSFNNYVLFDGKRCSSWHGGKTGFSVNSGASRCDSIWAGPIQRRICITTLEAPKNRRELYVRLAQIQVGESNVKDPQLRAVLSNNTGAIMSGYQNFSSINLPWLSYVKANPEKFMAKYPGQKMICVFDVTKFSINPLNAFTKPEDDRCSNPAACSSPWTDLIKCVLLPMGPAPYPFTPYIISGQARISAVYDETSTFEKPKSRVVIEGAGFKEAKSFELFDESGPLSGSVNRDFNFKYTDKKGLAKNAQYTFTFNTSDEEICAKLKNENIGCFPRIGEKKLNLNIIKQGNQNYLSIKGYNNELDQKKLKPSTIDFLLLNSDNSEYTYIDLDKGNLISTLRTGFHRNPNNLKNRFEIKKVCNWIEKDKSSFIILNDINSKCENFIPDIKKELSECSDGTIGNSCSGGSTEIKKILGYECQNGSFARENEICENIQRYNLYEDDYGGELLCARGFDFLKKNRSLYAYKKYKNTSKKYFHLFSENEKMLIHKFDDLNKNDDIKKFSDFNQNKLDSLRNLYDNIYLLGNSDGIKYSYLSPNTKADPKNPNSSSTIYSDESGPFYLNDQDIIIKEVDPISQGFCANMNNVTEKDKWEYIFQVPMYYANYDIIAHKNDLLYSGVSKLKKVNGIFSPKDPRLGDPVNFKNQIKNNVLMIPTKMKLFNPSDKQIAYIGISSENDGDKREFVSSQFIKGNEIVENFNVWEDVINELKTGNALYTDGTNLLNPTENLLDTSDCNTIEFEIHSGGGSSIAKNSNIGSENALKSNTLNYCTSGGGHAGQNGGYVKGAFRIRPNSKIIVKVGNANGSLGKSYKIYNDGNTEFTNKDDFSAIWIKEDGEKNENKDKSKPELMIKVASGSSEYYCNDSIKCLNLKLEDSNQELLLNQSKNLFQLNDGSFFGGNFNALGQRKSYIVPTEDFDEYSQNIGIESFRGANFTTVCGKTTSLIDTLPFSFPVILTKYNDFGIVNLYFSPNFSSSNNPSNGEGTVGDLNKVGSYFYKFFSDKNTDIGGNNLIDWSKRYGFDPKHLAVCQKMLESCFVKGKDTSLINDSFSINAANDSIFNLDPGKKSVDDLNLYCPGLGGCYYSSDEKSISHSGTAGLVKISCKQKKYYT